MSESGKSSAASWLPWIGAAVAVLTLVFGSGIGTRFIEGRSEAEQTIAAKVRDDLIPIKTQLAENKHIAEELRMDLEPGWGIQETYYIRAQRDGIGKHPVLRSRIDELVAGNARIVEHLDSYGESGRPGFREAAQAFRNHAKSYSSRWKAMKEAIENGADYPSAEPVYPVEFTEEVEREIAALKAKAPDQF